MHRRIPTLPVVLVGLWSTACGAGGDRDLTVRLTTDVGLNPHQIAFSLDGAQAYVAVAGSDRVAILDAATHLVEEYIPVEETPLGVAVLRDGSLAVTRFGADMVVRVDPEDHRVIGQVTTGGAPSLLVGPLPGDRYLVSVEQADKLWVLDGSTFTLEASYPTGDRPFPAGVTSDGRLAFVPNYDGGSVTVIDLWNARIRATVPVGEHPSGGTVLPGDIDYAVAVRGEDKIVFINTASFEVVDSLTVGIGISPFSVVVAPDGHLAFANNTASHDISVIDVDRRIVVQRIPVGEQPIVMAVHPDGETLWVSSEGSDELSVIDIPQLWHPTTTSTHLPTETARTQVAVMGMIHGRHPNSEQWGFDQLEETIRRFDPDIVCTEIGPDRWSRVWRDYTERGVVEDSRVMRFPEYNPFMLRLAVDMGFEIVPCAGWTQEMSDLRERRIQEFETDPRWADRNAEYQRMRQAAREQYSNATADPDDPYFIHSADYDRQQKAELSVYDEYLNDWIGPGGWTNINVAHMKLIDQTIDEHPGNRILITFGAGHKYWFLERLRDRDDIELLDLTPFLPER